MSEGVETGIVLNFRGNFVAFLHLNFGPGPGEL